MRTKTLLLTAAIGAAGIASSMAQAVYSVNYVGYVNKTLVPGFNLIANPLNNGNNQVATVFPSSSEGATIYKFNGATYDSANFLFGSWVAGGDMVIAPGDGFFFLNPDAGNLTVTFVGEGQEGPNLMNSIPLGLSIKASKIPQAGTLAGVGAGGGDLEFPAPSEGDIVYKWLPNVQNYDTYTFLFGSWLPNPPPIDVAEGFWYSANAALNWERDFEVTP
jgi:hypothetical protein